jgi:hypothetical protein
MRLNLSNRPRAIDLGNGVKVEVRPSATAVILAAGAAIAASEERGRLAFAKAVAREAIIGWTGVEGEDGVPLDVSPEAVDALMDEFPMFLAFEARFVNPALIVVTEGNA